MVDNRETLPIHADYLVIGAGTACLSFIDTILTENSKASIILVDRYSVAGGHWVKAYPYVRLHQPSANYGVNSLPLGNSLYGNGHEKYDMSDRANGTTIVNYYARVVKQFEASGRVLVYFDSEYSRDEKGNYLIKNLESGKTTTATCGKLVTICNRVIVPSMRLPPFPVDDKVKFFPVNNLPKEINPSIKKYVVIGAGKTGLDAVTYLLRNGVDQSAIQWVISRDVWYLLRDGFIKEGKSYWKNVERIVSPLCKYNTFKEVWAEYEKNGIVARLDPSRPEPKVFKGALIDQPELEGLRSVKDIVRMGRVTSISKSELIMEDGSVPLSLSDTLVLDACADMDHSFYGYIVDKDFKMFEDEKRITLGPSCTLFNPSFSSAITAFVETRFEDDKSKNDFLYILKDKWSSPTPNMLFGGFYQQSKTLEALMKYKPASDFILKSRTNPDAFMHHGGTLPCLWGLFGPPQVAKKAKKFVKKVENGSFEECKDCFGFAEQKLPDPKDFMSKEKSSVEKSRSYPQSKHKVKKKKSQFSCLRTDSVVDQ